MANPDSWEDFYKGAESAWGEKPDRTLAEYANLVPEGKILDLGIGDGRNSFFFARLGYEVEGFDISQTAVRRCLERAKATKLKVKAAVGDLRTIAIPVESYSLIIAAWVLNFSKKSEAEEIIGKMKKGLMKNGLVYSAVFTTADPGYQRALKNLKAVEENTFYAPRLDSFMHYFNREEFVSLFADLKVVYCAEGTGLDLGHGEPHYHGFVEYLGQRSG